jgi:hypothetical protein
MPKLIVCLVAAIFVLGACATPTPTVTQNDIDGLALQIKALGEGIDSAEAERAAYLAFTYSLQLREEYNVTDSPIIHNTKVNNGWRERGLCVHWAEDLEARLDAEGFQTLEVHRAIAEGNEFRIDHSTAVISRRGDSMQEGVVLDPWRHGGRLYWAPTLEDSKYFWEPQMTVLQRKAAAQ